MFKRRDIIKGISASAATGIVGLSGTTSAVAREVSKEEKADILSKQQVQTLLDEVGSPEIGSTSSYSQVADGEEISLVQFTTSIGDLRFTSVSGGTSDAVFMFDDSVSASELPDEYADIPNVGKSFLSVEQGQTVFIREATEAERAELQFIIDEDISESAIVYSSLAGGFKVDGGENSPNYVVEAERGGNITSTRAEPVMTTNCDAYACASCALTIGGGSGACGWVCRAANLGGIAGKTACIGCLLAAGYSVSDICMKCYNTCT